MSANEKLVAYMASIPRSQYKELSERIRKECFIDKFKLANWRSGKVKILPIYQEKIESIIGEKIF